MNWLARLVNGANLTPKSLNAKASSDRPTDNYKIKLVIAQAEVAAAKAYMRVLSEADPYVLKDIRDRMNEEIRSRTNESQEAK